MITLNGCKGTHLVDSPEGLKVIDVKVELKKRIYDHPCNIIIKLDNIVKDNYADISAGEYSYEVLDNDPMDYIYLKCVNNKKHCYILMNSEFNIDDIKRQCQSFWSDIEGYFLIDSNNLTILNDNNFDNLEDEDEIQLTRFKSVNVDLIHKRKVEESIPIGEVDIICDVNEITNRLPNRLCTEEEFLTLFYGTQMLLPGIPLFKCGITEDRISLDYLPMKNHHIQIEFNWFHSSSNCKIHRGRDESGFIYAVKRYDIEKNKVIISKEIDAFVNWATNHENIVKFYYFAIEGRSFDIVMEYVEYCDNINSIRQFLDQDQLVFTEEDISKITYGVISALKCLHEAGILHRNLKCSSILLNQDMTAKLSSFSLSRLYMKENNLEAGNVGSKLKQTVWLAPEVIRMNKHSIKSDIWSLGATVIEMATRVPPFWGLELSKKQLASNTEFIYDQTNCSNDIIEFIGLCGVGEPMERATLDRLLETRFITNYN